MDFVFERLDLWIKGILADTVCSNLRSMMETIQTLTVGLDSELALSPDSYNADMWSMLQNVIDSAIVPVASLVLTAIMCLELISWLNEQNNMRTTGDIMAQFVKFIVRLFIGVLLVQKSYDITLWVFRLSNFVIFNAIGTINTSISADILSGSSLEAIKETLVTLEIGDLLTIIGVSFLASLATVIIQAAAWIVILGRVIQIYMYCSVGAIPYATLTHKETSGIGKNYLLNLAALGFQGFFMLIAIAMYGYLINDAISKLDPGDLVSPMGFISFVLKLLCCGGALLFTLIGSKSLSKSIFNAH